MTGASVLRWLTLRPGRMRDQLRFAVLSLSGHRDLATKGGYLFYKTAANTNGQVGANRGWSL